MSNFVTIENDENKIKKQNLFHVAIFIGFTWILFHFTVVFFFGMILESVFLVGLFLGLGNIVAMLLDMPIGILQKYISPKRFLLIATGILFLVSLIFIKFIYFKGILEVSTGGKGVIEETVSYLSIFLNSGVNIVLLVLSAVFYGVIKESFDVTTLSYIFNISSPSEYAKMISKYNINSGIGSMVGLIFSGILLALNIKIAILIFVFIIFIFFLFLNKYFDNDSDYIELSKVKTLKLDIMKDDLIKKKDEIISHISPKSIMELSKKSKVILLKPIEIKKSIDFEDVFETTKKGFISFYEILFGLPRNVIILWFIMVILQFGFWDTFVSTFQVDFLNKIILINSKTALIKETSWFLTGYVLLGFMALPAFLLQDFFINLSKKMGVYKIIIMGLFFSATSLLFFGFFKDIGFVILFGLLNSVGYAASMPLAQSDFSALYNQEYSKKYNLTQIDSTISAAPLKILLNFANVIGLIVGGICVGVLGFNGFFIFFSFILFGTIFYSLVYINKIIASNYKLERDVLSVDVVKETKSSLGDLRSQMMDKDFN
ncbi:MAG: MFS transporter [Candidatus Gracilibacteria bacterium]|nr:MFS transporter [Candidatus Gracilibacteria bacterium]